MRKTFQGNFPERLKSFNFDEVTQSQLRQLRRLVTTPDFEEEQIRDACPAAAPLAAWCHAICSFLVRTRSAGDAETNNSEVASQNEAECNALAEDNSRESVTIGQYDVSPDITKLSPDELEHVNDLVVSQPGVSTIIWHGVTDCRDLHIPKVVFFAKGEVVVYPAPMHKPPPGTGLNKAASVTMFQCWPPRGGQNLKDEASQDRYRDKIKVMTEDKKAEFIDYNCDTGIWKFRVKDFGS